MTTTDSNGLIQYQTTDNVVPLQAAFNGLSSSVSASLDSTVRTFKVANDFERNNLEIERSPSVTNPLIVFNAASNKRYHEINAGSGWSRWIPANGVSSGTANNRIQFGTVDATVPGPGLSSATAVTFSPAFTSQPVVVTSTNNGRLTSSAVSVTNTGFTFGVGNWSPATGTGSTFTGRWIAIGPVAS